MSKYEARKEYIFALERATKKEEEKNTRTTREEQCHSALRQD
jgi:hypothetical protein